MGGRLKATLFVNVRVSSSMNAPPNREVDKSLQMCSAVYVNTHPSALPGRQDAVAGQAEGTEQEHQGKHTEVATTPDTWLRPQVVTQKEVQTSSDQFYASKNPQTVLIIDV